MRGDFDTTFALPDSDTLSVTKNSVMAVLVLAPTPTLVAWFTPYTGFISAVIMVGAISSLSAGWYISEARRSWRLKNPPRP